MPIVQADRLTRIGTALLKAAGASEDEARAVAIGLRQCQSRRHDSHGVIAIPTLYRPVKAGISCRAPNAIVQESPTTTVTTATGALLLRQRQGDGADDREGQTANVAACTVFPAEPRRTARGPIR